MEELIRQSVVMDGHSRSSRCSRLSLLSMCLVAHRRVLALHLQVHTYVYCLSPDGMPSQSSQIITELICLREFEGQASTTVPTYADISSLSLL